ncbi:MAG: uracil-DNA glycosylase [Blastocatellia bacterium]|nr:uracil-DNA glycosylase [Blastocatellia bacterium]
MNDRHNQSSYYDSLFGDQAEAPDRTETILVPPADSLDNILVEVRNNHSCGACKPGMPVVFGAGPANAALMLIGEGPGIDDIKSGLPFQGQAGVLLARMLTAINLSPAECYICNVIKCVPPGERNFSAAEIEGCRPFLLRQILAVNPRLIVAFGALAAQTLLRSKKTISELRGRRYSLQLNEHRFALIPIFNPAYLLRAAEKKREAWEDLKMVREFLRG